MADQFLILISSSLVYLQIRGATIIHWGLRSGNCVGQFLYWGIHWAGQCAHGLPHPRQDDHEQVRQHHCMIFCTSLCYCVYIYRADYCKALHFDPCCLPARVNLAYALQVNFNNISYCLYMYIYICRWKGSINGHGITSFVL